MSSKTRWSRGALGDSGGNVAMMFCLLLVPLLVAAGIGIDMMNAGNARAELSEAADAGLLVAARAKLRDPSLSDADLTVLARKHFDGNSRDIEHIWINSFDLTFDPATKSATLDVKGKVKTALLGVVGKPYMDIDILSQAEVVKPRALEVVLALDNTESMSGPKMDALKSSATDLVNAVMGGGSTKVMVGLVPFARHVNMGMSRINEPWLNIPADSVWNENQCTVDATAATSAGCSKGPSTCYNDGVPYACEEWSCPSGPAPTSCTVIAHPITWLGCVGSRDHPRNIRDEDFDTKPVPGILNVAPWPDCPNEVTPMTTDKAKILANIDALDTVGETYVPGGLFWAQALISAEAPFTEGKSYAAMVNESGVKAIVLMTDGENTASPTPSGDHYDDDADKADDYTLELCEEIKSKGVVVYTIAFEVTNPATQTMLNDCATNPNSFFNATNGAALAAAFDAIGNNMQELALTK